MNVRLRFEPATLDDEIVLQIDLHPSRERRGAASVGHGSVDIAKLADLSTGCEAIEKERIYSLDGKRIGYDLLTLPSSASTYSRMTGVSRSAGIRHIGKGHSITASIRTPDVVRRPSTWLRL